MKFNSYPSHPHISVLICRIYNFYFQIVNNLTTSLQQFSFQSPEIKITSDLKFKHVQACPGKSNPDQASFRLDGPSIFRSNIFKKAEVRRFAVLYSS